MLSEHVTIDVCMFRVAGHCFAIESRFVAEVLHTATLARVPLAADAIAGLLHLRGRIVPVIDMRTRLGITGGDPPAASLVIRIGDDWFGLLVDEVLDVEPVDLDRIEHPTAEGGGPAADAVSGIVAADERLVHVLDPERLVRPLARHPTRSPVRHGVTHDG